MQELWLLLSVVTLTYILAIRLRDLLITRGLNINDSSFKQAAV